MGTVPVLELVPPLFVVVTGVLVTTAFEMAGMLVSSADCQATVIGFTAIYHMLV